MGGDDLRVAGADGGDRRARAARRRRGGVRPLGAAPRGRRRGDRDAACCGRSGRTSVVGEIPPASSPTSALATSSSRSRDPPPAERRVTAHPRRDEALLELLASPQPSLTRLRLPPLRPARPVAHRSPPGSRRGRAPASAVLARARADARRHRPRRLARPASLGGALAVLEAARNVACAGGEPLGLTDCLNFGNPEKPEIGWELAEAIEGMAQACEALGVPVVSGNVSLYNDTDGTLDPTRRPSSAASGSSPDVRRVPRGWREGDASCSLARRSTAVARGLRGTRRARGVSGRPPVARPRRRRRRSSSSSGARRRGLARSSTTSPRAGSRSCLAEMAIHSGLGATLDLADDPLTLLRRGAAARCSSRCDRTQIELDPSADVDAPPHRRGRRRHHPRRARAELAEAVGHLMCGVFGIRSDERDVARLAYFGLFALQHRGQESAGIAVWEGGRITVVREMGLVAQVFDEEKLAGPARARWRSATRATPRPAVRTGRTPSRVMHRSPRARSRSGTTATSSTRRRFATS